MVFPWERKDHLPISQTKTKVLNRMSACVSLSPSSPTPCLWKQWHRSVSRRQPYALETANKKCLGTVYMIPNSWLVQLVLMSRGWVSAQNPLPWNSSHPSSIGFKASHISISWISTMPLREARGDCPTKVRTEDYTFRQVTHKFPQIQVLP